MKVAIIGAGAAGCFCAANLKKMMPSLSVEVFEAGTRALAKVAVTGGGRCNLTNTFEAIDSLAEAYPRGDKLMKRMFGTFDHNATMSWFRNHGVRLVTQEDNCVFPASQDAMQIVRTLLAEMKNGDVKLHLRHKLRRITENAGKYRLTLLVDAETLREMDFDIVVITTGGSPKHSGLAFLEPLGLEIIQPVPSLFTFVIKDKITALMGAVVEKASVKLAGTKFYSSGPLLITHFGMSGPAILRLSSYAARHLAENNYRATLLVNWLGDGHNEQTALQLLHGIIERNPQKQVATVHPEAVTSRIWLYIIEKCGIARERRLCELGKKQLNVLAAMLTNDQYKIDGQNRFKEEFVTCGGVALSNISQNTLEAKQHPGLYFAGEVLDVDAITGGFNLQAAWSMGYVIAKNIAAAK